METLKVGDEIFFGDLKYSVEKYHDSTKWYLESIKTLNDEIFNLLEVDKTEYTPKIIGYCGTGIFPSVNSLKDLTKLVDQLKKDYEAKFPTKVDEIPKFKKDDYIVITKSEEVFYNGELNYCYKLVTDDFYYDQRNRIPLDKNCKEARYATPEEITEYDRVGKPYDVTTLNSKLNFEVGKWYKKLSGNYNCYGKCCGEISGNRLPSKEYIDNTGSYHSNGTYFAHFDKAELLTDLSEIQQYLPEDHPDKIKVTSKKEYDLSTTITRAVKTNNPNILVEESGLSLENICNSLDILDSSYCYLGSIRPYIVGCEGLQCEKCILYKGDKKTEQVRDWLMGKPNTEEEFRVGDWIVTFKEGANPKKVTCEVNGGYGFVSNKILQIQSINDYSNYKIYFFKNHDNGIFNGNFRKATKEEIEVVTKPKNIDSEVDRNGYYVVNSQQEYKDLLRWLKNKGEKTDGSGFTVTNNWKYVIFRKNLTWQLHSVIPSAVKQLPLPLEVSTTIQDNKIGTGIDITSCRKYPYVLDTPLQFDGLLRQVEVDSSTNTKDGWNIRKKQPLLIDNEEDEFIVGRVQKIIPTPKRIETEE